MNLALIQEQVGSAPHLPVSRMCQLLEVGRHRYYRGLATEAWAGDGAVAAPPNEGLQVRDAIQRIALAMPGYGYRTITRELARRGLVANHKRVLRFMREGNLLSRRSPRFHVTTDSNHAHPVYPNLIPALQLERLDQLWVADITYIRLQEEFIYLAVMLDAFSRRCIGWALETYLDTRLTLAALTMALATRQVPSGRGGLVHQADLVHHSDRGVQSACGDYTALLHAHGIQISMSRRGNPYDNARAKSFIKTLKYEEVYLNEYDTLTQARSDIGHFLETVYNQQRLHSALGYLPPAEFEAAQPTTGP